MRKIFLLLILCLFWRAESFAENPMPADAKVLPGVVMAKVKRKNISRQILGKINFSEISEIKPAFAGQPANSPLSLIYRIYFSEKISPAEMALKLAETGSFEYVEPAYVCRIQGVVPNDTLFPRQFYLRQTQTDLAWTISTGSPDVVIAIVDNGTDYTHPDLVENLWTNFAEANGVPGIDDDGNGYIDDVHGWDFGENDSDPRNSSDGSLIAGHGTHTAGLAAASTNNITGIAGAGFSCKFMPVKTSSDDEPLEIPFGYDGIVYAADNGADIINCSWGHGGNFSQFEQDVINYAAAKGCLIIAAGGNNNSERLFYPAGYEHVFSVAALDEKNIKASYSSYGDFIDIAAPGGDEPIGKPGLLSLYPMEQGGYGEMSGTSMASPLVAGIIGLLRAEYPLWDNLRLYRQLALTADNIYDKNPDYPGKLGLGKVNAVRALTAASFSESPAKIHFFNASVNDSVAGNANFLFEKNEIVHVSAVYQNFALSSGENFQARLSSPDPDLEILDDIVRIDNFPADTILELQNSLSFQISSHANTHLAPLVLDFDVASGIGGSDTIFVPVGKSAVLLVDDDGGKQIDKFYTFWLHKMNVPFLLWDRKSLGSPAASFMLHFPMTIWFCEWAFPSLDAQDRAALVDYLDRGGDLFISGQDIGWDLADPNGEHGQYSEEARNFYENYLHSAYKNDNSLADKVVGMPGTPGQDMEFKIYQPGIPFHFQFPDWIEPTAGAVSCFRYENQKGAGVYFAGEHRVLNLGFGFEAIDSQQDEDPTRISRSRGEFMRRVFQFLGPLRHELIPDIENVDSAVAYFKVQLAPLVSLQDSLLLFVKSDSAGDFHQNLLYVDEQRNAGLKIHYENFPGKFDYYLELRDPYFTFRLPSGAPETTFSFEIGADDEKPKIFHNPPADVIAQNRPRQIIASVTDNSGLDTTSVKLHFETNGNSDSLAMEPIGDNLFAAEIPSPGVIGDSVTYFFTAIDRANNPNRAQSENYSYFIGRENFELGLEFWQPDSVCWGLDDRESHSPMYSVSTFPGGAYPKNTNASLSLIPGIPRSALKGVNLIFRTKYEIESGHDFGFVEVEIGQSGSWQRVGNPITGTADDWIKIEIPFTDFYEGNSDSIFLRFRFRTDSLQSKPMSGWFIDDVEFQKSSNSEVLVYESPKSSHPELFQLLPNFPNPFNSITRIKFWLRQSADVKFVLLNLKGQRVREFSLPEQSPGLHNLRWNGTNFRGERCSSGVYFLRMTVEKNPVAEKNQLTKTIKMVLLQ